MPHPVPRPLSWLGTPMPPQPQPPQPLEPGAWSAHQLAALDDLRRVYAVTHDAFSDRELLRLAFWRWLRVSGRLCEW